MSSRAVPAPQRASDRDLERREEVKGVQGWTDRRSRKGDKEGVKQLSPVPDFKRVSNSSQLGGHDPFEHLNDPFIGVA